MTAEPHEVHGRFSSSLPPCGTFVVFSKSGPAWGTQQLPLDVIERQDGCTYLSKTEPFSGLFIRFDDLPVPLLTEGYDRCNEALRQKLEQGAAYRERDNSMNATLEVINPCDL